MNRRRFILRSMGATLALPGLCSLSAKALSGNPTVQVAKGAGIGARRFVAIGNLLGYQTKQLFPKTTGRDYEKTTLLEPVWEQRELMTVFRGLDHGVKGGHFAVHSFLSGVLNSEAQNRPTGNVSIDQFLAEEIGHQTRFPSLTVGSEGGIHGGCQLAWTKSGVRVPPVTNPAELFDKLFASDSADRRTRREQENRVQASILDSVREEAKRLSGQVNQEDKAKLEEYFTSVRDVEKRLELRPSILDSVREEAKRLSGQVNQEDKAKLEEYFTSVRDVEKRLELRQRWTHLPKPAAPFAKPANRNAVDDLPLMYELIALALQTDSTRIATLEIGGDFLPQHLGIKKDYHGISHHGNDPESIAALITLERYQIAQYGKFIGRLAQMKDGEGTLLDSTTVLFGSGMGDANSHRNTDLPIFLAGGGYKHGQFREVAREVSHKVPLCNLFVDIAQKMGVETHAFGSSTGRFA